MLKYTRRPSRLDSVTEDSESLRSQPGILPGTSYRPPPSPMKPTSLNQPLPNTAYLVAKPTPEKPASTHLAPPAASTEDDKKTSVYCMDGGLLLPPRRLTDSGDRAVSIASTTCIQAHLAAGEPIFIDVDRGMNCPNELRDEARKEDPDLVEAVREEERSEAARKDSLHGAAQQARAIIAAEQAARYSPPVKTAVSYNITEKPLPYSPSTFSFTEDDKPDRWSKENIIYNLKSRSFYTRCFTLFLSLDLLARIVTLLIFLMAGLSFFSGVEQLLTLTGPQTLKTLLIPIAMTIFSLFVITLPLQALTLMYGPPHLRRSTPLATALLYTTALSATLTTMASSLWFFYAARSRKWRELNCASFSTHTSREREKLAVMNGPLFNTCVRRSESSERYKLFWASTCLIALYCTAVLAIWAVSYRRRITLVALLEEAGDWEGHEKLGIIMDAETDDLTTTGTMRSAGVGVDSPELGGRNNSIARYPSLAVRNAMREIPPVPSIDERQYVYHDDRSPLERERDARLHTPPTSFSPTPPLPALDTSVKPAGRQLVSPVGSLRSIRSTSTGASSGGGSFASTATAGHSRGLGSMTVEVEGYRVEVSGVSRSRSVTPEGRRVVFEFPPTGR
ncbi:hypothetical protein BJ508DRAFT_313296 [Ascobolus immersus RN42]|uniref:Uncharacterized protein n=1 Tax=Ascobolus immersus RN42 TaxID=1160509 RepID=A0A3N4HJD2_ASCIM|nr:hypothetical protein BJ508DRAFT_313296 [Ascobolus immersus RN42]